MNDYSVITRITKEMIEDYAMENTIHLEIRTTPRSINVADELVGMRLYVQVCF